MAPGRARKVLAAKQLTKKQQASYDANAASSPLLRLPPEIRNRIFNFVLSGNTIHLWSAGPGTRGIRHSICKAEISDEEAAQSIKALDDATEVDAHRARHGGCELGNRDAGRANRLSLGLLVACRQIHQEAALLPFTSNTFTLGNTARNFLKAMLPGQVQAISSIVIVDCSDSPATAEEAALLESRLNGLTDVVAFREFNYRASAHSFQDRMAGTVGSRDDRLLELEGLRIARATVAAYSTEGVQGTIQQELVNQWSKEIEARLTAGPDGLTYSVRTQRAREKAKQEADKAELERRQQRGAGRGMREVKKA